MSVEFDDNIGQQNAKWQQMNQPRQQGGLRGAVMKMFGVDEKKANLVLIAIFVAILGLTAYFITIALSPVRATSAVKTTTTSSVKTN